MTVLVIFVTSTCLYLQLSFLHVAKPEKKGTFTWLRHIGTYYNDGKTKKYSTVTASFLVNKARQTWPILFSSLYYFSGDAIMMHSASGTGSIFIPVCYLKFFLADHFLNAMWPYTNYERALLLSRRFFSLKWDSKEKHKHLNKVNGRFF